MQVVTMRRLHKLTALGMVLVVAALLAACGADSSSFNESLPSGIPENMANLSLSGIDNSQRGLENGKLAPDFQLEYGDGRTASLSNWRGQPVVLNFWATWCAPCRAEMPELVEAYQQHQEDGLVVVGVNAFETIEQAAPFLQEFGMSFPVAMDSRGELQQLYQVRGLPTTLFIDREGRVVSRWSGLLTAALLEDFLDQIL